MFILHLDKAVGSRVQHLIRGSSYKFAINLAFSSVLPVPSAPHPQKRATSGGKRATSGESLVRGRAVKFGLRTRAREPSVLNSKSEWGSGSLITEQQKYFDILQATSMFTLCKTKGIERIHNYLVRAIPYFWHTPGIYWPEQLATILRNLAFLKIGWVACTDNTWVDTSQDMYIQPYSRKS